MSEPLFGLKIGDEVQLCGSHPLAGTLGTVESFDDLVGLDKRGAKIRLADGHCVYATRADHVRAPRRRKKK